MRGKAFDRVTQIADHAPDLAALLCSRLCHDLMSPVGALANGLELLADETEPGMRERCLALLEQSARTAGDKLRFFRVAFGASGGGPDGDAPIPVAETRALIEALAKGPHPIAITWLIADEALSVAATKVLLNLALIGLQALVRGGTLDCGVERTADGGCDIVVRASAPRVVFDPDLGRALDGSLAADALTSRTVAAALVHDLARAGGGTVQHLKTDDTLLLGANLPHVGLPRATPSTLP